MIMSRRPKFLQKNLDFGGHQKIFGTDIIRKYLTKTKAKHFESNLQTNLKKVKIREKVRLSRPPASTCEIVQSDFRNRILFT